MARAVVGDIRADILAGLVLAVARVHQAIAFSFGTGVAPKVGLHPGFSSAVRIAFAGDWPGMVSATTAATAVPMMTRVCNQGLKNLLVDAEVAGLIQIGKGLLKPGVAMGDVSNPAMTGFVNAMAIPI